MGLSETIVAASIGAAATVMTALFQLFGAIKSTGKSTSQPKRGSTTRSIIAVLALMIASGVGGFMFSELRQERASQDIHSLREELNAKLQVLENNTARLAEQRNAPAVTSSQVAAQAVSTNPDRAAEQESSIYAPACGDRACTEAQAQNLLLCDSVAADLRVTNVDLFVRGAADQRDWALAKVSFNQDAGGGKFVGTIQERVDASQAKMICVTFMHWSSEPHIARMVLRLSPTPEMSAPHDDHGGLVAPISAMGVTGEAQETATLSSAVH